MEGEGFAAEEDETETRAAGPLLQLFPNPARGSLSVLCSGFVKKSNAQLRFVDATGRIVLITNMQGPLMVLDVSQLNGFFTVVVETDGMRMTGRVMIQ